MIARAEDPTYATLRKACRQRIRNHYAAMPLEVLQEIFAHLVKTIGKDEGKDEGYKIGNALNLRETVNELERRGIKP